MQLTPMAQPTQHRMYINKYNKTKVLRMTFLTTRAIDEPKTGSLCDITTCINLRIGMSTQHIHGLVDLLSQGFGGL